jgi:glutathione peroxidase
MARISRRLALLGAAATIFAAAPRMSFAAPAHQRAWDFSFSSIEEGTLSLADYRGRVLLVTNTASFCGFTHQFRALQALQAELGPRGLTVIGVPSEDFPQESDSPAKVQNFCESAFGVEFPMAGITHVKGEAACPFYHWVRSIRGWEPVWNFSKVLIGRNGAIVGVFGATDEPDGDRLRGAILKALAAHV